LLDKDSLYGAECGEKYDGNGYPNKA
jgi:hypothetical protein